MAIKYLSHPTIEEILRQQRLMLEFHMRVLEIMSKMPMEYTGQGFEKVEIHVEKSRL